MLGRRELAVIISRDFSAALQALSTRDSQV